MVQRKSMAVFTLAWAAWTGSYIAHVFIPSGPALSCLSGDVMTRGF